MLSLDRVIAYQLFQNGTSRHVSGIITGDETWIYQNDSESRSMGVLIGKFAKKLLFFSK